MKAAEAYGFLTQLASASTDAALKSRAPQFLRRQADAAAKAGSHEMAERCYVRLIDESAADDAGGRAAKGAAVRHKAVCQTSNDHPSNPRSSGASAEEGAGQRLELMCLLADARLGRDRDEVEARVQARLAQAASNGVVRPAPCVPSSPL